MLRDTCFLNDLHLTNLQNLKTKYFQHYVTFTDRTLLKIIQREKEEEKDKETVKTKGLPEASFNTDRFTGTSPLMYYTIPYNLWYRGYCSARDLITELIMMWLLLLAINPLTAWFFHPFLFGWTQ